MNKEQQEQFDKMGVKSGLYDACVEVDDIKQFISQIKADQRQEIKKDLLKIAKRGEMEELRREVERYFEKL